MDDQKAASYRIQRLVKEIEPFINEETFLSLLLVRLASKNYHPPIYQFKLEDLFYESCPESVTNTIPITPWDVIVNKQEGSYTSAIVNALQLLEGRFPFAQEFIDENKYQESDNLVLHQLVQFLSDLPFCHNLLLALYEEYMARKSLETVATSGDFYMPKELIQCLGALLEPTCGSLYDPCCGSGAMLLGAAQVAKRNGGLKLFGQTQDPASYKICLMNAVLHEMETDLGKQAISTLISDQHANKAFDYIIANPPFNLSNWHIDGPVHRDERWFYGIPPHSNANFAWMQHILFHLKEKGRAVVLMPNGSLTSRNRYESRIRREIIKSGVVEAIITFPPGLFYATKVPFCVWILDKSHEKDSRILFVDVLQLQTKNQKALEGENYKQLINLVKNFRKNLALETRNGVSTAAPEEIVKEEYILSPNRYMKTKVADFSSKASCDLAEYIAEIKNTITDDNLILQIEQWAEDSEPVNWKKTPLLELYETFGGLSAPKTDFGKGYPFLDTRTIIHNTFLTDKFTQKVHVSETQKQKYNIRCGDIFLNRTSESIKELGCCCGAVRDCEAVYTGFAKRLRPKKPNIIDPFYAAGYFQSDIYRMQIMNVATVFTTRASLNNYHLERIFVYYPPWDLQKRIGSTLYAIFNSSQNDHNMTHKALLTSFQSIFVEQIISRPILTFQKINREEENI